MLISVLGGDARSEHLAAMLAADGHTVICYGLSGPIEGTQAADTPVYAADFVIGPTPCLKNGLINMPSGNKPLHPGEVAARLRAGGRFAAGVIPEHFRTAIEETGAECFDFMEDEALAQANASPSAEGAIQLAMERMDITLAGCEALVMGFGRIGRILTRMLRAIGAHVTVYARREEVLERAWQEGARAADERRLSDALPLSDCIFNTIPAMVLDAKRLSFVNPQCVILDLASAPGGTDFDAAKALGLRASLEPGLPGRVAPRSAALYMKQALYRLPDRE